MEKITYPTGGSVLYGYEANTHSYDSGLKRDRKYNQITNTLETDENFYFNLNYAENRHNYFVSPFLNKSFSSSNPAPLTFTLTQSQTLYFKFDSKPYTTGVLLPDGSYAKVYPYFTLRRQPDNTLIKQFRHNDSNYDIGYGNLNNICFGNKLNLSPGTYTIDMGNSIVTSGNVNITTITPVASPKKWWYGGGIRIKTIGYFSEDVPQDYYRLPSGSTNITPEREINYDYTLIYDSSRSSGSIRTKDLYMRNDFIRYKNITVYDSQYGGRIEYDYDSPIDFPQAEGMINDFRTGKLRNRKIYNSENQLQLETEYEYDSRSFSYIDLLGESIEGIEFGPEYHMGWSMPVKVINKEYLPESTVTI